MPVTINNANENIGNFLDSNSCLSISTVLKSSDDTGTIVVTEFSYTISENTTKDSSIDSDGATFDFARTFQVSIDTNAQKTILTLQYTLKDNGTDSHFKSYYTNTSCPLSFSVEAIAQ